MMRNVAIILLLGLVQAFAVIDPVHDASLWDKLLMKYIREDAQIDGITLNVVNYAGMAADPDFGVWLGALETAKLDNLTRNEIYAFYSNVYNSLAINMMIQHACRQDLFGQCGTISGIRDIGTIVPFQEVWNKPAGTVGGKVWTLQQVEDYMLTPPTPYHEDPRVHAAIVCASVSCPDVRKGAYTYEDIDGQYNQSFNHFLFNPKKGMSVDTANNKVYLSSIFKWYGSQFKQEDWKEANVLRFILLYLWTNHTDYEWLSKNYNSASIAFFDYDWNANVDGKLPCASGARPCFPLWALLVTIISIVLVVAIVIVVVVVIKRRRAKQDYQRVPLM